MLRYVYESLVGGGEAESRDGLECDTEDKHGVHKRNDQENGYGHGRSVTEEAKVITFFKKNFFYTKDYVWTHIFTCHDFIQFF